ncbi:MAG: phosphoribosylformylglycinamidine synthase [Nitrospirae bacterium RBG_19FT_COMBO_42_15]|nr:MAG: phosphoribosylformylglycinamidine synthase [Nitrospirae bacterium RBG_19FT_COMBO_42_15]
MKAKIFVTLKKSVLDPQGKTIQKALNSLGFKDIEDVRAGKYFEIKLSKGTKKAAEKNVKKMCEKLLSNTVIEDYNFKIEA